MTGSDPLSPYKNHILPARAHAKVAGELTARSVSLSLSPQLVSLAYLRFRDSFSLIAPQVTRTQGVPTEDDEQVSVNLIVVQKKEVSEDKSDLKLGGIEPSTTRFDGEPSVEAADELKVMDNKTDSKLGGIEPSIRSDGESTLDSANEQTATKKERKIAEDKPKQVSDAKQSYRIEGEPQRGAAHPLTDAANQLTVAGFQLKSRDSFTGVGFALHAAGQFLIDAGLKATGHALIAAGFSLMTVSEVATPTAEGPLQIAGRGTNENVGISAQELPGPSQGAPGVGKFTEPVFNGFPLLLSSSDGATSDASADGSPSDASHSDGSRGEESESGSQSPDVIVGGPKFSYLNSVFEQQ